MREQFNNGWLLLQEEPAGGNSTVLVRRNQGLLLLAERDYKGPYRSIGKVPLPVIPSVHGQIICMLAARGPELRSLGYCMLDCGNLRFIMHVI